MLMHPLTTEGRTTRLLRRATISSPMSLLLILEGRTTRLLHRVAIDAPMNLRISAVRPDLNRERAARSESLGQSFVVAAPGGQDGAAVGANLTRVLLHR